MSKNYLGIIVIVLTFIILMGCPIPNPNGGNAMTPVPTNTSSATPTPVVSPTITPTPTGSSTITPTPTLTPTITPSPTNSSTVTSTPTINPTPTSTLSPKNIFDAFEKVRQAVITKAKKTPDLNPDLVIDVYRLTDSSGGTFELQEIYDFPNQITTYKYIFTNFNDNGTVYNCPAGQEIIFISSTGPTPPANPWQGRVNLSGNMTGYIIYHNTYADVNGTQVPY